jgi:hypothetical protein
MIVSANGSTKDSDTVKSAFHLGGERVGARGQSTESAGKENNLLSNIGEKPDLGTVGVHKLFSLRNLRDLTANMTIISIPKIQVNAKFSTDPLHNPILDR